MIGREGLLAEAEPERLGQRASDSKSTAPYCRETVTTAISKWSGCRAKRRCDHAGAGLAPEATVFAKSRTPWKMVSAS